MKQSIAMMRRDRGAAVESRRERAAVAALLYFIAVLVLPAIHLAFHRADHHHAGGGIHWAIRHWGTHDAEAPHQHGAHEHEPSDLAALPAAPALAGEEQTQAQDVARAGYRCLTARSGHSAAAIRLAAKTQAPPRDPAHGLGSLAHFSSACLTTDAGAAALGVQFAPVPPVVALASQHLPSSISSSTLGARGPPVA